VCHSATDNAGDFVGEYRKRGCDLWIAVNPAGNSAPVDLLNDLPLRLRRFVAIFWRPHLQPEGGDAGKFVILGNGCCSWSVGALGLFTIR
jgi:hypothetical protein